MAVYRIADLSRREILRMCGVLAACGTPFPPAPGMAEAGLRRTPSQVLGPFYPLKEMRPNSDMTRLPGHAERARGQLLNVFGRVLNVSAEPVRNARLEVWQANSYGRYAHPSDSNAAPLDPNFQGSAVLSSDANGRYQFKTIKPAAYPVGPNTMRPAHIHFQVSGRRDRLITQMYFDGDPYNDTDPFLNSADRKDLLIMKLLDPPPELEPDCKVVRFDIVLFDG